MEMENNHNILSAKAVNNRDVREIVAHGWVTFSEQQILVSHSQLVFLNCILSPYDSNMNYYRMINANKRKSVKTIINVSKMLTAMRMNLI